MGFMMESKTEKAQEIFYFKRDIYKGSSKKIKPHEKFFADPRKGCGDKILSLQKRNASNLYKT
jgi:hypothetical protein